MSATRDYLEKLRANIRKDMQPLAADAADLRSKLAAVDSKLRALTKEDDEIGRALEALSGHQQRMTGKITIKEAVLEILRNEPNGMTSSELLAALNSDYFNGKLVRTSMSPQLARLWHKDKKITYRGDKYFLA